MLVESWMRGNAVWRAEAGNGVSIYDGGEAGDEYLPQRVKVERSKYLEPPAD
jgi:hypothetical protein